MLRCYMIVIGRFHIPVVVSALESSQKLLQLGMAFELWTQECW